MLSTVLGETLEPWAVVLCTLASLALGVATAMLYMFRNRQYTKSFAVTLALMPAMTQMVILMVNGNIGTGVAVMGAFSLIRFRSVAGSARELGAIFLAMALGLCTGAGYLVLAALFLLLIGGAMLALNLTRFGVPCVREQELRITIPESLDYEGLFDDLFDQYASHRSLERVKTANMGSLYELSYHITLKKDASQKDFLDALRCRNGNLTLSLGRVSAARDEL